MRGLSSVALSLVCALTFAQSNYTSAYDDQLNLACRHLSSGEFKKAVDILKIAIKLSPTGMEGHFYLATAYYRLEKFDLARSAAVEAARVASGPQKFIADEYVKFLEDDANGRKLLESAGQAFKAKKWVEAATDFESAWKLFPKRYRTGLNAAYCYCAAKNLSKASELLLAIEKAAPGVGEDPTFAELKAAIETLKKG